MPRLRRSLRHSLGSSFPKARAIVHFATTTTPMSYGWFTQREMVRIMIAQRLPRLVCCVVQPFQRRPLLHRFPYSTDAPYESTVDISTPSLSPRWLSDIKERLGRCIMFGMKPDQVDEGGQIAQELARDWRTLIAGGEGFLTGKGRVGLQSQAVVWGEQDTMVR